MASLARAVEKRFAGTRVVTDFQNAPGDEVPPRVNEYQPDVFAGSASQGILILGEAKTPHDIDSGRSLGQLAAFIRHLEQVSEGTLILSVPGHCGDLAKTTLRVLHTELRVMNTRLEVFDQLDFWTLDREEGRLWHLS